MHRESLPAHDLPAGDVPSGSGTAPRSDTQSRSGITRRTALTALSGTLATGAVLAGAGAAQAADRQLKLGTNLGITPKPATRTLDSMFDEAASRYGVPGELLAAVGWTESRLEGRAGAPSMVNGFGIMHLVDNPTTKTLAEAARLTGVAENQLRTDDASNILGGAALLRARADALRLTAGDRGSLSSWMPVTEAYSGVADRQVAEMYAAGVSQALSGGFVRNGVAVPPKGFIPWDSFGQGTASNPPGYTSPVASPEPIGSALPAVTSAPANPSNYAKANRPNDYAINYIVIHVTQGSYTSAINWFQNSSANVSAHYIVRSSDGKITQCVDNANVAWHAGNRTYNYASIGIEHEGYITQSSWFTDAMYRSSAALVRSLCDRYGIPKTRSRIIGHIEVPQATHTDPGPLWNWSKYMSYVTAGTTTPSWQLILDNTSPEFSASSNWQISDWSSQKWGANYRFATSEPVTDTAWYSANLPANGRYVIECRYPADAAYNNLTPYVIATPTGNEVVYVDQTHLGAQWRSLGTYDLTAGYKPVVGISRWAKGTGYVIADAIRISRVG